MAPTFLYRYRSFVADPISGELPERGAEELQQAKLRKTWFSKIRDQNDPFDTNPNYQDSSIKEVREFLKDFRKIAGPRASFASDDVVADAKARGIKKSHVKRLLTDYRQQIAITRQAFYSYQENALISCFSTEINSILMWSYYGKSHSSYCLRFKLDDAEGDASAVADVRYLEKRPYLSTIDMMKRMAASSRPDKFDYLSQDDQRVDNATLLSKSSHWKHEMEWRAIKNPEAGQGYYSISPYKLDRVILGAVASDQTEKALRSLADDVGVSKCKLSSIHYQLELED